MRTDQGHFRSGSLSAPSVPPRSRCAGLNFHLELDFAIGRDVYLDEMAAVLDEQPHLVQLALRRPPWNSAGRGWDIRSDLCSSPLCPPLRPTQALASRCGSNLRTTLPSAHGRHLIDKATRNRVRSSYPVEGTSARPVAQRSKVMDGARLARPTPPRGLDVVPMSVVDGVVNAPARLTL